MTTLHTSDRFIAASASGTDWRDTARQVLEALEPVRTGKDGMTVGFLYLTDNLADHALEIINLFKSVTGIQAWTGTVGLGVCASGIDYIDCPAISVLLMRVDPADFRVMRPMDLDVSAAVQPLAGWMERQDALFGIVHADPMMDADPSSVLAELERATGAFLAGGLCSSRGAHAVIAEKPESGRLSGILVSQNVAVATALTQGCAPMGPAHRITRCEDYRILELDDRTPFDVFKADIKSFALTRKGRTAACEAPPGDTVAEAATEETDIRSLFKGEVHAAFTIQGSDQKDYLVRNIIGIDTEDGTMAVAHQSHRGEMMMFVHRDDETVRVDLSRTLLDLRARVERDHGRFAPQGALYISCVARAVTPGPSGATAMQSEMTLVREILGDLPLAGFYANGEISNHRLYGYTAVIILFL